MKRKKYTKKDFLWVFWTAGDIKKIVPELLEKKREIYKKIKSIPDEKRTFENTVYALASSDDDISHYIYKIYLLLNVSPKKEVREEAKKAIDLFEKESVDIEHDKGLYEALLAYASKKEKLEEKDKKLLSDMLLDYKRMGFDLEKKEQKKLKSIQKKLAKLQTQFAKNINDYQDHILVSKKELEGLPESYLLGLKKKGEKYLVGLSYPELLPFMQFAKNGKRRKELADKNAQKGGVKNLKLAKEILSLREELKNLLGYKTYTDYALEIKMAKNAKNVFKFLDDLMPKLKTLAKKDILELEKIKKGKINYYDVAYYENKLKEEKYKVDSQKLKEYFPFQKVKEGVFEVYSKLFSVKFERVKNIPLWHKDAELYKIKEGKETIAYFGLDMYPREGKYGHAAVFEVMDGRQKNFDDNSLFLPHMVCMVANIKKPTKEDPSLMSHGEVETFFHEFGHIMHQCLSEAKYSAQAGFKVAWDFVEAPSQMLENWVWDKKILKILSGHYQTGKKIPDNLADALIKSKKCFLAYSSLRQLSLASFDMIIHTKKTPKKEQELKNEWKKIMEKWIGIKISPKNLQPTGFAHIFGGGYSAGYYGYMWSKVYASCMFERFKKEGVLNKKTGKDYKNKILKKGATQKELELVKDFLGKKPSNKAFLKEIGL
jgi:thimet oligopeptidase